jgi:uncharacterized protein
LPRLRGWQLILPEVIPLFPLPNVVFFPGVPLPLHIFEPRYRAMVRDATAGSGLIGVMLLRGDWEPHYHSKTAPIFQVGTAGEAVRVDELPDGRFNLVLRGVREFVVRTEPAQDKPYREALVDWWPASTERVPVAVAERLVDQIGAYVRALGGEGFEPPRLADATDDVLFINGVAQQLDVSPLEKQSLLEVQPLAARAARLSDVLAFRLAEQRGGGSSGRTH